jgi:hypothetical protein
MLLFGNTLLKHGHHFDQSLIMRMCICYLDSHDAVLCCYLVIDMENLLQLF